MLRRGNSSWVTHDKCIGESLGQTQKTGYFPKSSKEFFNWKKTRPLSGMNPLPASPPCMISCKPCFAIQQVSWLQGWTNLTEFIRGPWNIPSITSIFTQSSSQGFFSVSSITPTLPSFSSCPSRIPHSSNGSPATKWHPGGHQQAAVPCLHPDVSLYVKHKIYSTYMVNCEQRKQLSHPSQHHMAGCKK